MVVVPVNVAVAEVVTAVAVRLDGVVAAVVAIRATLVVAIVMVVAVDVNQRVVEPVVEVDVLGEHAVEVVLEHVVIALEHVLVIVLVPPDTGITCFIL